MNRWIAACLATLIAISLAGAIGEEASAAQSEGNQDVQYEERSHIRIRGDQDLEEDPIESQLPGYEGPDNGVRSGSGTEDDPFVIERWRIEYTGAGSGVWVEATTHHLVIRDLQIWSDAPEGKQGHAIVVYAANNVQLERIEFDGLFLPFLVSGNDIQIRDMEIPLGKIEVEYSKRVLIEDVHIEGAEAGLRLAQSQGLVRDTFVNQTTDDGRRHRDGGNKVVTGISVSDGGDCDEGNTPSRWIFNNVRVISFEENSALWLACDVSVEVTDSLFQESKQGVHVRSEEATFVAKRSTFSGNEHGILVGEDASCHCRITESNFFQNDVHIENNGDRTVEAVDNWWGSPDGPAEGSIVGPVEYEPWLDEGEGIDVRESPAPILFAIVLAIVVFVSHRRKNST